jgi:phage-related minor tail protein
VFSWFRDTFTQIGNFIKPIVDFIQSIIDKARDAIQLLQQIGGSQPSQTSAQIVSNGLPANMPTIPGRAAGGAVRAGQAYMVGEHGPEPFIPSTNGTIIPTGQMTGGSSVTVQSLVINASGMAEGAAAGEAFIGVLDEWQSRGNR